MKLPAKVRELADIPRHVKSTAVISYIAVGIGIIALIIAIASLNRKDEYNGR